MRVVLASRNPGKLMELDALLAPLGFSLESQAQHGVPSPPETGLTFVENALIKARAVSLATQLPAIADDSGLVVPALSGEPGIRSARYAGEEATDEDNNAHLMARLRGVPDRRAWFYCAMVMLHHAEDPTPLVATAAWHGRLLEAPRGQGGFGYDPYFLVDGMTVTSAELPAAEKNRLSHRGQAAAALAQGLRDAD